MQKRLIASIAGGVVGICVASSFEGILGLSETVSYIGCSIGGIFLGYIASTLFDVFSGATSPGITPE